MPQLSDRFSAYPVSVTLDANGDGTIRFQAQGKNIVITNLYVSVATQTLQAKCTIFKQNIGPQWAVNTTNSGSTGASARGRIELLDGEAVYVVWDGGDANAVATATFTGYTLPFSVVPESGTDFEWADPIAAGDGAIIYPALKSPNFVAGVSGWSIDRDGSVEFNDGIFRDDLSIIAADGAGVTIAPDDGIIFLYPATTGLFDTDPGTISTHNFNNPISGYSYVLIQSPMVDNGDRSSIFLASEAVNGNPPFIQVEGRTTFNDDLAVIGTATGVPGTRIATDTNTSDSGTFTTTETELQSVTALLENGKTYTIRGYARIGSSSASDHVIVRIREDSDAGTERAAGQIFIPATSAVGYGPAVLEAEYTAVADGNKTFVFTGQRNAGAGNCIMRASGAAPARLYVNRR